MQEQIADDPSILGLGDLVLKDKERRQPRAGRLDLLLLDPDNSRRYEVELQLGRTDETHIIRTLEYWDIERKRYPQYDHCAVIIAEDITSRFLNVISLFNGYIPIIALQMSAFNMKDGISLVFTKVVDELELGLDDEEVQLQEPTTRDFWLKKSPQESMKMADDMLAYIKEFAANIDFKFNKHYIGLAEDGQPYNFVTFRPLKKNLNMDLKLPYTDELRSVIEDEGLTLISYDKHWNVYRIKLSKTDVSGKKEILNKLMKNAYEYNR